MGTTCIAISQLFRTVWAKSYWEHSNDYHASRQINNDKQNDTKLFNTSNTYILVSGNNYYNHRSAHTNIWTLFRHSFYITPNTFKRTNTMITIATNPVTKRHMQQMVSFREHFCKGKKTHDCFTQCIKIISLRSISYWPSYKYRACFREVSIFQWLPVWHCI